MDIDFRIYKKEDYYKLSACIDNVCAGSPWMSTSRFEPDRSWLHALENPGCRHHKLILAEKGENIIGWSRLFPENCYNDSTLVDVGIGLLEDYRGIGIGSQLMQQSLLWARTKNISTISLYVRVDNRPAYRLFIQNGFQAVRINGPLIHMTRQLPVIDISSMPGKMM